jgi:hypothetical protein
VDEKFFAFNEVSLIRFQGPGLGSRNSIENREVVDPVISLEETSKDKIIQKTGGFHLDKHSDY